MKKFNKNTLSYRIVVLTLSNLILHIIGFIYRIELTKLAGTEALGLNSLIMQIYQVVIAVCMSGLCIAVTALAAKLKATCGEGHIGSLLRKSMGIYLLLWALIAIPIFVFRRGIADTVIGDVRTKNTLALMLVCIFMTGIENILKAVHIGTERVRQCAASELCEQAIRFMLVIALLSNINMSNTSQTVFYIMLGMVFSEFFSVGFLSISYAKSFAAISKKGLAVTCKGISLKDIMQVTLPATVTSIASNVFASIGSLVLPSCLVFAGSTRSEALSIIGIITNVAVPITILPMAAVGAVSSAIMPAISEKNATSDPIGRRRVIDKAMSVTSAIGVMTTAAMIPAAPMLGELLFGVETDPMIFLLLGIKSMVIYYQMVSVSILNGLMKQKAVLFFAASGELFQLILIILLSSAKGLGIYGYLMAMIAGEACRLVCNFAMIEKYTSEPVMRLNHLINTVALVAIAYIVSNTAIDICVKFKLNKAVACVTALALSVSILIICRMGARILCGGKRKNNMIS